MMVVLFMNAAIILIIGIVVGWQWALIMVGYVIVAGGLFWLHEKWYNRKMRKRWPGK